MTDREFPPTEADRRVAIDETLAKQVDELLRGKRQAVHGVELWEIMKPGGDAREGEEAVHLLARLVAGERRSDVILSAHAYIYRLHNEAFDRLREKAYKAADDMAARERWEPKEPS
jgi:hypothetical protein